MQGQYFTNRAIFSTLHILFLKNLNCSYPHKTNLLAYLLLFVLGVRVNFHCQIDCVKVYF